MLLILWVWASIEGLPASECGFQDLQSSSGFKVGEGFRFVERVGFVFGTM